ncbi:MAG: RNA-guided endonuclease InsQ/TnpB family protein [Vulcanimicrobiaceae bacterium]
MEQCRELTALRAYDEQYAALNCHSEQVTLKRLDLAFQAFFRRVKSGQTAGFPRFRSFVRFSGWGYKDDGFKFTPGNGDQHGRLNLTGVGTIAVRGRARTPGEVRTCEIQYKAGRWYASLSILCEPESKGGAAAVGMDWGVETFATLARENGGFEAIDNPRFFKRHAASVARAQRRLDDVPEKDAIGRPLNAKDPMRIEAQRALGRAKAHEANARKVFLHQRSAQLVAQSGLIAAEELAVKNMVRSAKGTAEQPGKNVVQKAGLNREILATSPSLLNSMLRCKAEEAGSLFIETPTKKLKPSQRCSDRGRLPKTKTALSERQHVCECGCALSRDENGARNNLVWALTHLGREPAGNAIPEATPWVA